VHKLIQITFIPISE